MIQDQWEEFVKFYEIGMKPAEMWSTKFTLKFEYG